MRLRRKLGGAVLAGAVVAAILPGEWVTAAPAGALAGGSAGAVPGVASRSSLPTVTLITGDRVTVLGSGKLSMQPGAGRSGVTFLTQRSGTRLTVIPSDTVALLHAGRLDHRLFDVNLLLAFGYDDRRPDLPLIVTYAAGVSAPADAAVRGGRAGRVLPSVNGVAVRAGRSDPGAFWRTLTAGGQATRMLPGGINKVWLDGLRRPALDSSVAQIGAPAAHRRGLTGTGVTVAVLDSGIDANHPDLADRVTARRNFTEDPDSRDVVGHGTHVASTIAGTGAASAGRYAGVAPGAKLLDGKVCEPQGCAESAMLAGMEWGAANAAVVNMSISGPDSPEVDPIEQAVNRLTAQHGTLFVIAAGNNGPGASTVGSPGSADAALTVGAVDSSDEMADFSSRGPRTGDGAIKPDITAPGVDITAARSPDSALGAPGDSYTALSGTSMAAPHVAGAAAILAQQHPTWTPAQLKSALMGSAQVKAGAGVLDQGAGRVDVGRAVIATVTANPASVSFGRQQWPHGDDAELRRTVSYHNSGSSGVVLRLVVAATGPGGSPAPDGMFRLSAATLTVPAGGDASIEVIADSSVGAVDGIFGGQLTATTGALTVRTPIAVEREVESYDLTLIHTDRDGRATGDYYTGLWDYQDGVLMPYDADGTVTLRLPRARYLLTSTIMAEDAVDRDASLLLQPAVNMTRARTIRLDARRAKAVSVTVPRRGAEPALRDTGFTQTAGVSVFHNGMTRFDGEPGSLYTAQLGSQRPIAGLASWVTGTWADRNPYGVVYDSHFADSRVAYTLFWYEKGRFHTGFRRKVAQSDLATVREDFARHAVDGSGEASTAASPPDIAGRFWVAALPFRLPFRRTLYVNTDRSVQWQSTFIEGIPTADFPYPYPVTEQVDSLRTLTPGKAYARQWNGGVFGPALPARMLPTEWVTRGGDVIYAGVPLYGDRAGHNGSTRDDAGLTTTTTLFRNGRQIPGSVGRSGLSEFEGPPASARYRLRTVATRGAPFTLSTRVDTSWTFRSGHVPGETPATLPVSVVRFAPALDLYNTAPRSPYFTLPITVQRQPGAPAGKTERLTVSVSYDDGATWQTLPLVRSGETWTAQLTHPNRAGFVSLRAGATDTGGNTVNQTIIRAYRIAAGVNVASSSGQ